jgi:hypothetical protein
MSFVVTNETGRPVAAAEKQEDAELFAYRNSGGKLGKGPTEWSPTGKLMVGGRWTGWEVREVASL